MKARSDAAKALSLLQTATINHPRRHLKSVGGYYFVRSSISYIPSSSPMIMTFILPAGLHILVSTICEHMHVGDLQS